MSRHAGGAEPNALAGRLFLAVTPPSVCRDEIARYIRSRTEGSPLPGRRVPAERWHLTLKFLGDTSDGDARRLENAMDEADLGCAFGLRFAGLGAFPSAARAKVLWMDCVEGASTLTALAAVVDRVAVEAGFEAETRPYRPHLTLSRLRPPRNLRSFVDSFNAGGRDGAGAVDGAETETETETELRTGTGAEPEPDCDGVETSDGAAMRVDSVRLYRSHLGHRSVRYELLRSWSLDEA